MMSRKNYINMARLLHRQQTQFKSPANLRGFISALCNVYSFDNPRFNSAKFIDAVYNEYWGKKRPAPKQSSLLEPE